MTRLELLYSETEQDLRRAVREAVSDHLGAEDLITRAGDPAAAGRIDRALWTLLGRDLGLAGLLVADALGGQGATVREAGVVAEELGRTLAPVPFLTATVADTALAALPSPVAAAMLGGASGLVAPVGFFSSSAADVVRATANGRLHGSAPLVPDAADAEVLLVAARAEDGLRLFRIGVRDAGVRIVPAVTLDATRGRADVDLAGAPAEALADPDDSAAALGGALRTCSALLACEHVGIADWCLDTTIGYLAERRQFGRVVGGFQAIKHRLADLWLLREGARSVARAAVDALASDLPDADLDVAVARSHCQATAVRAAEEALQLHGGIGMTWEHPLHLYLKRAKSDELGWEAPARLRAMLADLADLPA